MEKDKIHILASIPFGEADYQSSKNYDNFDFFSKQENNPFDYFIKYIYYSLNKDKYIGSLKIVYQNINSDKLITLLDTLGTSDVADIQKIEFKSYELITNIKVWTQKDFDSDKLTGFEIKTTSGRILKIGYEEKKDEIINYEFKDEKYFILGFGVDASPTKVTSIYFYYIDRSLYKKYNLFIEILKLRAKLMLDNNYKKKVVSKKFEYDDRHRLVMDMCELPNLPFFRILSYIFD